MTIDRIPPSFDNAVVDSRAIAQMLMKVRQFSEQQLAQARGSHDWEHTLRVHRLCRLIGPLEGADMLVIETAAYLHDIGRSHQDQTNGAVCHAAKGAQLTEQLIRDFPLPMTTKENIIHCVRTHRFRDDCPPNTLEAKVLFDADKLDAIGAVGVARAYLFAGELGACLHNPNIDAETTAPYSKDDTGYREYIVKLSKIKAHMLTATGRHLADERHAFMVRFFDRFVAEYEGRC